MIIIQSLKRAMDILGLFSNDHPTLGISEISRILGLNKGTVQGLVQTLLQGEFLQRDPDTRKYHLGSKVYELGNTFARNLDINLKASNTAHRLSSAVESTVRVAIWDNLTVLVTLNAEPRYPALFSYHFGPRVPAYCTALGKAVLSHIDTDELETYFSQIKLLPFTPNTITEKKQLLEELEETRRRGYSINREEHLLSRYGYAAPIFTRKGRLAASISIAGDPSRMTGPGSEQMIEELLKSALEISGNMGFTPDRNRVFGK